jgi:hypothetical protein
MAVKASVGCEFAAHLGHMFANIDLGKTGGASVKLAVAEFAEFSTAADRHVGDLLSLVRVCVQRDRAVAEFAPHDRVGSVGVRGCFGVVTHRAGRIAEMANRPGAVIVDGGAAVPAVLSPGIRDKKRPAQEKAADHCKQQNRGSEDVFGVDERALRIHGSRPPSLFLLVDLW